MHVAVHVLTVMALGLALTTCCTWVLSSSGTVLPMLPCRVRPGRRSAWSHSVAVCGQCARWLTGVATQTVVRRRPCKDLSRAAAVLLATTTPPPPRVTARDEEAATGAE